MKYVVRCGCGTAQEVSAADAGSALRCACGRAVDVPALHMLRASVGEQPVSPAIQIQAMLLRGELPGTKACACCHRDTDHLIRVSVVCERVITKSPSGGGMAALAGCFALGWMGLLAGIVAKGGMKPVQHGTDVSFVLPVCVCEVCDHDLGTPATLRTALVATPVYSALLDRYPNALVRRIT